MPNFATGALQAMQIKDQMERTNLLKIQQERKAKEDELQHEINVTTIFKHYLDVVPNEKEWVEGVVPRLKQLGVNDSLLKTDFSSPEEFEQYRAKGVMGSKYYESLLKGDPQVMSKTMPNGQVKKVTAKTKAEAAAYRQDGFDFGEITGTPKKTEAEELDLFEKKEKIKDKYRDEPQGSDFERAYKAELKNKPNLSRVDFKREWEKPPEDRIKTLNIAAKAAGVDPEKAAKGEITPEEAKKILKEYGNSNGTNALIELLLSGGVK